MSNENLHDDLDDFLKNTFEGHTITPGDELWAKIEPQINMNMVPFSKYVRMKYAFIGTAASLVAVVFLLFTQNTSILNPKKQDNLSIVKNSGLINPTDTELENLREKLKTAEIEIAYQKTKSASSENRNELNSKAFSTNNSSGIAIVSTDRNQTSVLLSKSEISKSEPNYTVEINPIECQEVPSDDNCPANTNNLVEISEEPVSGSGKAIATSKTHSKSATSFHLPKIDFGFLTFSGRRPLNRLYGDRNNGIFDLSEFMKKVEVGFNYSPLLSTRTLGKNQITENGNIDHQYFNDIEKALLTNNFGLDLLYRANDRWTFRTGLYFTQYRHETQNDALHRDVISPEQLILNTSAGKIPVTGTGMDQLPTLSVFNTRIDLSYLEVPLVARYYWDQHFFTDAGMNYSYLRSSKTSITSESYTGTYSYSGVEGIRTHNFALGLGLGIDYKLSSRFKLEIGPEVKWQVNSFSTNGMNTHPLYWGIRAGIRFKWRNPGYKI
ncbi:MAG: porin family protein [Prolixibacteraceae bacterium]